MNPLESYFQNLSAIRSSGAAVKETSYYGTLDNLLNEIGQTLKPKVRSIINIANKGGGLPDGGFFTPDQFQKRTKGELIKGQLPARGCIEVKSPAEDVMVVKIPRPLPSVPCNKLSRLCTRWPQRRW